MSQQEFSLIIEWTDPETKKPMKGDWFALPRAQRRAIMRKRPEFAKRIKEALKTGVQQKVEVKP